MPRQTQSTRLRLSGKVFGALGRPFLGLALWLLAVSHDPVKADDAIKATGLPVPRFVSLKSDRVNVRQGPTREHGVAWIFTRQSLPVEIVAEFDNWRRVRDSDGAEGWVFHSLLSGRRTALIAPWAKDTLFDLHRRADGESPVVARLEPKVLADVTACDGAWCRVKLRSASGYIRQESLWGVYPNESME